MKRKKEKALICFLVNESSEPLLLKHIQAFIYYIERTRASNGKRRLTTYTFSKYYNGPVSETLQNDVEQLIAEDYLYEKERTNQLLIDYRSKCEELLTTIDFEMRQDDTESVVETVTSKSPSSIVEKVKSFTEVQSAEKYTEIELPSR